MGYLNSRPVQQWTKPVSALSLWFLACKAGGSLTSGFECSASLFRLSLFTGVEAWECDTSLSSGKSSGGTCGHFSDWERGCGGEVGEVVPQ